MRLKFHEHASRISAAWLWTRIRRVSASRRWMLNETLGYVEGGSDVIVSRLAAAILQALGDADSVVAAAAPFIEGNHLSAENVKESVWDALTWVRGK